MPHRNIINCIENYGCMEYKTETSNARADSRFSPSQWETSLQSNAVSHWLGANQESALKCSPINMHLHSNFNVDRFSGTQINLRSQWHCYACDATHDVLIFLHCLVCDHLIQNLASQLQLYDVSNQLIHIIKGLSMVLACAMGSKALRRYSCPLLPT